MSASRWRAVLGCTIATICAASVAAGCKATANGESTPSTDSGAPASSLSSATPQHTTYASDARPPFTIATRLPGTIGYVREYRTDSVIVGERWGCAKVDHEGRTAWRCWDANAPSARDPHAPRAFAVPWLDDKEDLIASADHLCAFEKGALTLRCWKRPSAGESAGHALPERGEWLNPHHTSFYDTVQDRATNAFVGGTFACLQSIKDDAWCVGNNAFGQLGNARRLPDSDPDDPPLVGVWPAASIALGTSHGCAIAAPNGLADNVFVACWGRGDLGQLGSPPPAICKVNGQAIGCARSPQRNIRLKDGQAALAAGDQFTCVTDPEGIRCWGANRDGFFGAPGSCPAAAMREWPTVGGPINAPSARCSRVPVRIPLGHEFHPDFAVGPRGVCVADESKVQCVGAIPSLRLHDLHDLTVSAGQDASACALRDGSVFCWGEGYSRPNALDVPVAIELGSPPEVAEVAVVGATNPAGWGPRCVVRTKCTIFAQPLATCGLDVHARDWFEVSSSASTNVGQTITVRGPLGVGPVGSGSLLACWAPGGRACCNPSRGPLVLGGESANLALQGFFCEGDESQSCCNAPAYGQSVVATGELVESHGAASTWELAHAVVCLERGDAQ